MMNLHLRSREEPPMPPENADFSFTIDFKRGEGNPRRVFDAASELIEAFELLDQALAASVDETLEPVLVLEDVESGSLKVWLRNVLERIDDEAIKTLEWKPLVGKYLLRAKYLVLDFCQNDSAHAGRPSLGDLKAALRRLAEETDIRHMPDYPEVDGARLISAIDQLQKAKRTLGPGDTLTVQSEGMRYLVDLSASDPILHPIEQDFVREVTSEGEMILTVRRPDMLKDSKWQFVHGGVPIAAAINDQAWLDDYHARKVPLFPGDALRCRVSHTYEYDATNVLVADRIAILEVLERVQGQLPQGSFFA